MKKTEIQWEQIFSTSMKITLPYVAGLTIGSKIINQAEWVDIILNGLLVFGITYGTGLTVDRILCLLQNYKAKKIDDYKNKQNSR